VIAFKLAESAACTAVVLSELACLIRHDSNTRGKKNHFFRRKSQHTTDHSQTCGGSYFLEMAVFWLVAPCNLVEVSEVLAAPIIRAMTEAARTSEILVNFYQITWRYNPEDSHLCAHRRENLKSYFIFPW
jgi:hypothetical protein